MLTDCTAERPLSPAIVELAESDLILIKSYLLDRLRAYYPVATVSIVLLDSRVSYHIDARATHRPIIAFGFRAADATVDNLLADRPMTLAEIERTLGTDTAYSGDNNAA